MYSVSCCGISASTALARAGGEDCRGGGRAVSEWGAGDLCQHRIGQGWGGEGDGEGLVSQV